MQGKKKSRAISGMIIIDKPLGLSSNKVLQKVKHLFQAQKAGHTGSLDPLATGVLPICFGEATKYSQYLLNADKVYIAGLKFGQSTSTADAEGEVLRERPVEFSLQQLNKVLADFVGEQQQIPSMFSALKHQGQPLYKLARQGIEIERQARPIHIYALNLLEVFPESQRKSEQEEGMEPIGSCVIRVHCSKGTYIRNLVEDIGEALECGAHVSSLRRIQSGTFSEMLSLDALTELSLNDEDFCARDALLLPVESALMHFPEFWLDPEQVLALKQGKTLSLKEPLGTEVPEIRPGYVRLLDSSKKDLKQSVFMGLGLINESAILSGTRLMKTN